MYSPQMINVLLLMLCGCSEKKRSNELYAEYKVNSMERKVTQIEPDRTVLPDIIDKIFRAVLKRKWTQSDTEKLKIEAEPGVTEDADLVRIRIEFNDNESVIFLKTVSSHVSILEMYLVRDVDELVANSIAIKILTCDHSTDCDGIGQRGFPSHTGTRHIRDTFFKTKIKPLVDCVEHYVDHFIKDRSVVRVSAQLVTGEPMEERHAKTSIGNIYTAFFN
jgi:hypothetical protein